MRELVTWAAATPADAIPEDVVRRAALVLADNISALVAVESELEVEGAQALFAARASAHEAAAAGRASARPLQHAAG